MGSMTAVSKSTSAGQHETLSDVSSSISATLIVSYKLQEPDTVKVSGSTFFSASMHDNSKQI